jgi:hypothetical protein
MATAATLVSGGAIRVRVEIIDAGYYSESVAVGASVFLYGPSATVEGTVTLDAGSSAKLKQHYAAADGTTMVDLLTTSGSASFYEADVLDGRGLAGSLTNVDLLRNGTSGRVLFALVGQAYVPQGGNGVKDATGAGFGHVHINIRDLYLAGNNARGIRTNNANTNIIGYIDHILEIGTPTGTVGISMVDAGSIVKLVAAEIIADTVYDLTAGSLHLLCPKVTGALTGTPIFAAENSVNRSTDGTFAANSDTLYPSQKATKTYVDAIVAVQDAMVFKGVQDCSTSPDYPAADRGWTYRVSVAGKIGGASGISVEVGDIFICLDDGTVSGNQAAQGSHWSVVQTNIDGAVVGPASATDVRIAVFDGTSGKLIKDGGSTIAELVKLGVEDQSCTGGIIVTSKDLGTISSGTVTPDPGERPQQHYTNGGAHTLAPSTNGGSILLDITNNASAGGITTSGWTKVVGSFTTTNGHKFRCHASIGNAGSLLSIQALQ